MDKPLLTNRQLCLILLKAFHRGIMQFVKSGLVVAIEEMEREYIPVCIVADCDENAERTIAGLSYCSKHIRQTHIVTE